MGRKPKGSIDEIGVSSKKKVDIFSLIQKVDDSVEILKESVISKINDWIPTGSYILNACVSGDLFKGVPGGRVTILAGESGCGKSYLACSICREAQLKGYKVIYMDSEAAITADFVERLGCNPENFLIKQVNTVNETNTFILNVCEAIIEAKNNGEDTDNIIMVLDSIGNLTSDKEKSDAEEGKNVADFTRTKELKKMFRLITVPLAKAGIPLIAVNHTYTQVGAFIPTQAMGGGCLVPEERIITKNGVKEIQDVVVGDKVLGYDNCYHSVLKIWRYEKQTLTIHFDNDSKISCSVDHRFLTDIECPEKEGSWVKASEIKLGTEIFTVDGKIKVVKVVGPCWNETKNEPCLKNVCDLTVEDVHSYVSENGIINHNSGTKYASTVTLYMSGSKLEDKENDKAGAQKLGASDIKKSGVKVTCCPEKSRLCIPHKVRFQIPFFKNPNPYTGLENYLNWDNAGIMLGKCYTESDYLSLKPADQTECVPFDFNGETRYAQPKKSLTKGVGLVCKHLGRAVTPLEFWSPVCFTPEFMTYINENIIKPEFELPSRESFDDLTELEKELEDGDND